MDYCDEEAFLHLVKNRQCESAMQLREVNRPNDLRDARRDKMPLILSLPRSGNHAPASSIGGFVWKSPPSQRRDSGISKH